MEMNDTLLRSVATKSKRTLDTIHEKFALRDTDRRQKITTGDALFGNVDRYENPRSECSKKKNCFFIL
jgi:hypothetical protein